jgi:hypothetical protein
VIDWKTGYSHDPEDDRDQLAAYALAVASLRTESGAWKWARPDGTNAVEAVACRIVAI